MVTMPLAWGDWGVPGPEMFVGAVLVPALSVVHPEKSRVSELGTSYAALVIF